MPKTADTKVADLLATIEQYSERGIVDRVHPRMATHVQATLRWSITDPPLQQTPPHLADIIGPDPDWPWFSFDWDALHLWLTAAYSGDGALLAALRAGDDLHTLNACDLFGLPVPSNRRNPHTAPEDAAWRAVTHWEGKDDRRRVVAKRFIFRVLKGGDFRKAPDSIPLAVFGGKAKGFITAAQRWAYAHAPVIAWQERIRAQVREKGEVRTYSGKRRRLSDRTPHAERAGIDFMCQATEVEILNDTILETVREFGPLVRFKFQRHDNIIWAVHRSIWTPATLTRLAALARREVTLGGQTIRLTATCYTRERLEDSKQVWTG